MGQRPAHLKPPAYLSKSPPVPTPEAPGVRSDPPPPADAPAEAPDPTRYGDWERKGIAVDF